MTESGHLAPRLRLISLGAPRLELLSPNGETTVCLGPGKPLAVLAFLAFAPRQTASRESLCDLLWGDSDIEQSRPALRQALWTARRKTLAVITEENGEGVALRTPVSVDASEFALAVQAGELQTALDLYTGEFFSGFSSPGASDFEKWSALQRSHFRALFVHTAEASARQSFAAGRFTDVLKLARRLHIEDPFGELGWRLSLEALTSAGELVRAHAEADAFEEWLRADERDPEPATAAAIRAARNVVRSQVEPASERDRSGELVGREAEFTVLQSLWEEARVRGARRVHIVGDSGLGKTRLVSDLCKRLRATRARVAYYRANPGERHIAFASAAGLAATLATMPGASGIAAHSARVLLALNPTLSSYFDGQPDASRDDEALRRRSLAIGDLVSAIADEAPIAIVIDDFHWCDPASRQLIAFLSARLSTERVLLVSTERASRDGPLLPADTRTLQLRPITHEQIEQLIGSLGTLPSEEWSERFVSLLSQSSKGNPLLVLETLRICVEDGLLSRADDSWCCSDVPRLVSRLEGGHVLADRIRKLGESEQALLLVLATSGRPLTEAIAANALGGTAAEYESAKAVLESRCFVTATDGSLTITHDEIAAVVADGATPEAIRHCHHRLGAAMESNESLEWRRRGVQHLAASGDIASLVRVLPRELTAPRRGTLSLNGQLASLLGLYATPEMISAVRPQLPWRLRHATFPAMIGVLGIIIVMTAGTTIGWTNRRTRELPEATLLVARPDSQHGFDVRRLDIGATYWQANRAVDVSSLSVGEHWIDTPLADPSRARPPVAGPWPIQLAYPDSGALEIAMSDRHGIRHRLTNSKGDDRPIGYSPDGRLLLIETTRWSREGHPSLALLDPASGRIRTRLTHMPWALEWNAMWEQGGERIGFVRDDKASGVHRLCLINVDGTGEHCPDLHGWSLEQLIGWIDESRVLIRADSAAVRYVLLLNLSSSEYARTVIPGTGELELDPSGRWIFRSVTTSQGNVDWMVGPVDHFERAQRVLHGDRETSVGAMWWPVTAPTSYIDRITIERPRHDFVVGVPYALRLSGFSKDGRPLAVHVAEWRTIESAFASIDSNGVFLARDTGTVIIEGSAGGWRSTQDTIHVVKQQSTPIFDERWTSDFGDRWRLFGDPLPRIERDPDGTSWFFNNGDGEFFSGAYLRTSLKPRGGIAIDVDLSSPITEPQWQVNFVFLMFDADLRAAKSWDHRTGYLPAASSGHSGCSFGYPSGEGLHAALAATPIGNIAAASHGIVFPLSSGRRFHLRIQLLPDGRCAYAIDGHPLLILRASSILEGDRTLVLEGNSVATRMLIGPIRVFTGVPTDIDWTTLRFKSNEWRPSNTDMRRVH